MGYVLLAAGIVLIVLGSRIINARKSNTEKSTAAVPESFENMFSSDLILQKLNNIESRLNTIEDNIKPANDIRATNDDILYEDLKNNVDSDINSKIAEMKENGFTVDEISEKYGITKGEVLLRASLKK